jgi:hypothetical protein
MTAGTAGRSVEDAVASRHHLALRIAAAIVVPVATAATLTLTLALTLTVVMIVVGKCRNAGEQAEHRDGNEQSLHGIILSRRVNPLPRQKFRAAAIKAHFAAPKSNCFVDMFELPKSLKILGEACERDAISFAVVDNFSGFVARLSKDGKSVLAGAAGIGVYPLNRAAPFAIARDKAFTHSARALRAPARQGAERRARLREEIVAGLRIAARGQAQFRQGRAIGDLRPE